MKNTIPYTYLIGWPNLNKWYYGVRYAKHCNPTDLFSTYFTSSSEVFDFIKSYGMPSVIQVRKIINSPKLAQIYEHKVLRRIRAKQSDKWLNKSNGLNNHANHSGRKTYYDPLTNIIYKRFPNDPIIKEKNLIQGWNPSHKENLIKSLKNTPKKVMIHQKELQLVKRISPLDIIPEGWELGQLKNNVNLRSSIRKNKNTTIYHVNDTENIKEYFLNETDPLIITLGLIKGRHPKSKEKSVSTLNKVKCNNGKETKFFQTDEIPEGWKIGGIHFKTYNCISPNGDIITINNIVKYCKDNNLTVSLFKMLCNGRRKQYKGYKCLNYSPIKP